jgi:ketosteroid isomerase-like protein
MRRRSAVVLLPLITSTLFAKTRKTDTKGNGEEQTLTRIEQEMLDAMLKGDASANEKYMADSVVLTAPDGDVLDKARLVGDIKSGKLKMQSSTISDMQIRVLGDTAVATYITTDKGTYGTQDISGRFRWTDVFKKQGGKWQLIAGHGSPAAKQ